MESKPDKASWRVQRDAKEWARIREELAALTQELADVLRELGETVPPLFAESLEGSARVEAYRADELRHREQVDEVVLHWCDLGRLDKFATSLAFWIDVRFDHAMWTWLTLRTPDPDGISRYLPLHQGHLLKGFREWLLIHSWKHAGAERYFAAHW